MRGSHVLPADPGTLHSDGDLAFLERLAILNLRLGGARLSHPEIVSRVGEDADVLHGGLESGGSLGGRHVDLMLLGGVSHNKRQDETRERIALEKRKKTKYVTRRRKTLPTYPANMAVFPGIQNVDHMMCHDPGVQSTFGGSFGDSAPVGRAEAGRRANDKLRWSPMVVLWEVCPCRSVSLQNKAIYPPRLWGRGASFGGGGRRSGRGGLILGG